MRYRRPAAIAASIAVLAVAVPFTLYLVQTPRVADQGGPQGYSRVQEQPRDNVAALSKPAPADPPAPPATTPPAPPTMAQIAKRPNSGDQRRLPDEDAGSLVFDDTLLFDIDKFSGYDRFVTFRPSYNADRGVLWGSEFRHRLKTGRYSIDFAAIDDELNLNAVVDSPLGNWRGSLQAKSQFNLGSWWKYSWDITLESANGQAPYDIGAGQRTQDVYPFKLQEDECFVLTASYIETFVENPALEIQKDRTLMLRYELRSRCQSGYRTDALSPFFYDFHRENAPISGSHVANSGAEACPPGRTCTQFDDTPRKNIDPIGQVWTPFAKTPGGVFGPAPKIDRAQPVYLQADKLIHDEKNNRVIAQDNVEIYYNSYILTADKIIYDKGSNRLTAEGNAQLKAPNGSINRADRFEATDDFRDAFIQSLSLVTMDNTRIAAENATRREGNVPSLLAQARKVAALPQAKAPPPITTSAADVDRKNVDPRVEAGSSDPAVAATWQSVAAGAPAQRVQACPPGRTCTLFYPKQIKENAPAQVAVLEASERSDLPRAAGEGRDRFAGAAANPVKSTASEPVSTFSIDVDSASYSFVRRVLNAGQLPPKEAVRVEEMINYFPYDYPLPEDKSAPFRPTVTVLPSPWNPANKLVHIAIKGYDVAKTERPRANLVLLIDTSGSMTPEDRLPLIKNAFRMLIDTLRPDDTVGIVTYAGQTRVALESTKVADKRKILEAIEGLHAGGSTAGGAGIQEAYRMAEGAFDKAAVNRVVLATDGDFNVGITNVDELKSFIERKRETGIFLSVLGVGHGNYNDALMQALAQNGNGVAAYIDTLNEARKVLVDEASSTLFAIAKDVKIQIEFNPAVVAEYRLIGYETRLLKREDFNNDKVDAGDIGSGHTVTAIYEITPVGSPTFVEDLRYKQPAAAAPKDAKGEYAFLRINYKLPAEAVSRRIELPITPALEKAGIDQASTEARFSVAVAAFGQLLRGDPYLKDFGYDQVIALAATARGEDTFGYRAEFLNLVRLAKTARP